MSGFAHDIAGGSGDLIVTQLQSPDFSLPGETGWAILRNGDAYFFNITASGSITTNSVIIEGSTGNVLIYSGVPSSGDLVGSWAGAAGSDGDGNSWTAGLTVGAAGQPQVALIPLAGQAAELQFPVADPALSAAGNVAGNVNVADGFALIEVSGPALSASGHKDWVQVAMFSDDTAGDGAHMDFRFIDTSGSVTVTATYDASGWTFQDPVTINSTLDVVTTLTAGALVVTDGATFDSGATFDGDVTISAETLNIGNGSNALINLSPPMANPADYPYNLDENTGSTWATGERSYINQLVNGLNALVESLQNRGLMG